MGCAAFAVLVAFAGIHGCGDDDNPAGASGSQTLPEEWAGIWEVTLTSLDCQTDSILEVVVELDTLCAGESVDEFVDLDDDELGEVSCTGSFTSSSFSSNCTGQGEQLGCTFSFSANFNLTLRDSTFTGTGRTTVRLVCSEGTVEDCADVEISARRLSTDQPGCGMGTSALAGRIWSRRTWPR